jgi:acyl carrier protein
MSTVDRNEILERVINIVKRHAVFNQEKVMEESRIRRDHGIDSIKMVELVVDLEEEFNIEVDSASLSFENFANIGIITDFIIKKLTGSNES